MNIDALFLYGNDHRRSPCWSLTARHSNHTASCLQVTDVCNSLTVGWSARAILCQAVWGVPEGVRRVRAAAAARIGCNDQCARKVVSAKLKRLNNPDTFERFAAGPGLLIVLPRILPALLTRSVDRSVTKQVCLTGCLAATNN
jgi:hypothetical protein